MEVKPTTQKQETDSKKSSFPLKEGKSEEGGGGERSGTEIESRIDCENKSGTEKERGDKVEKEESKNKKNDGCGGSPSDNGGPRTVGDPGPSTCRQDGGKSSGKEKEGFPSLFISHASINISGSNPDLSESEKFKIHKVDGGGGKLVEGKSGSGLDSVGIEIPQRVVVHRVCSDSRIGEGEGFHSSKLAFYNPDGSFSSSLKALGLSVNSKSRSSSIKSRNKQRNNNVGIGNYGTSERAGNLNKKLLSGGGGDVIKSGRNEGLNLNLGLESSKPSSLAAGGGEDGGGSGGSEEKVSGGGNAAGNGGSESAGNGNKKKSASSGITSSSSVGVGGKHLEILPVIEQSLSEQISKVEHPSTSEGDETLTEDPVGVGVEVDVDDDVVLLGEDDDEDELLLEEYDEPNETNLHCDQLDFGAAVSELLLRPEKGSRSSRNKYKDSATWTQEDDMPSPDLSDDLSPVASPRRKKERNLYREFDETGADSHSHNSLLEQYHQYLLEQQHPQVHRSQRGGGSGSQHRSTSSNNPKSSIVGIHQGNLKSSSHSHHHHHQQHHHTPHSQHHHPPLPPPPPPQHAECFTVSSQLLSREAKLYENVPASHQGELETLEILLASGGSGDSNYPPSGGSGSGGGASNTTASTSNTSGQSSGQSGHHNLVGSNLNNNGEHRHHHHHLQQQQHQQANNNLLLSHPGFVHGQHSHSATNLNTNAANSSEQLFSVSDFLGPGGGGGGGGLTVGGNNNGQGPPSRTSWADSGRESLSFDGDNNNSSGSTRNLLLIPPPPPPPINYLTSGPPSAVAGGSSSIMHSSSHHQSSSTSHHHHHSRKHSSSSHHHHSHHQSSDSPSRHNTRRSRRERLVRQKHAINDETIFPSHHHHQSSGGDLLDPGLTSNFMAVPSPRRTLLPGSMQASNFVAAAASPINLQRHPPPSQLMLQENKKNCALIACESPYGIMAGGNGTSGLGGNDWAYPETFGDNFRRATNKSHHHLTSNLLRSRSPSRGHGGGGGGKSGKNNSSFDYGELPSHQMFPKRHLLQQRQFPGHHRPYNNVPGATGTLQQSNNGSNGNGICPPTTGFQPMQHRSFPAGMFSGTTPRSCSMGDLTSSAASVNGSSQGPHHHHHHHHQHSVHPKTPEGLAISSNTAPVNGLQSSTVPLVTSLPLPPATSVTYEFSLAPVSGTLAPGWHLTAVQRGLATAVPLAAAVARRRLPRPRTSRPRFGFTDKNEARRAKWTIVITALALLAMSMLLVGITLRLAPLIDDLGKPCSN